MIAKISDFPSTAFKIVPRMFSPLIISKVPPLIGLAFIVQVVADNYLKPKLQFSEVLIVIFEESILKNIALTGIIYSICIVMYLMIFVTDFITGVKASRKEHKIKHGTAKGFFDSEKAYSSIWKFFAVILISTIISLFSVAFAFVNMEIGHRVWLIIILFFFFMVMSFDIYSIGENQKRRFGDKPAFFDNLNRFFIFIGNLLLFRVQDIFGAEKKESADKFFKTPADGTNEERINKNEVE